MCNSALNESSMDQGLVTIHRHTPSSQYNSLQRTLSESRDFALLTAISPNTKNSPNTQQSSVNMCGINICRKNIKHLVDICRKVGGRKAWHQLNLFQDYISSGHNYFKRDTSCKYPGTVDQNDSESKYQILQGKALKTRDLILQNRRYKGKQVSYS